MATPHAKPKAAEPAANTNTPKASRMALAALVKGKIETPYRLLMYGVEGVGKSTFAAAAPSPVFIGVEDGTAHLDVTRFPAPESWPDVLEAIRTLTAEEHGFRTLVLDTLDWAEPLLWAHICKRDNQPNIEAYGYGKGYAAAVDEWRVFLSALERLIKSRRMHVIMLAHSWVKSFKNPEGDDFDRYELKLHAKAGGLLKEWCDAVLFCNHETFAEKDKKTKRVRGVDTGARLIYTQRRAAYDAKNRYGLPESLPLSWEEFDTAARAGGPANVDELVSEVRRKAAELGGELEKQALEAIKRANGDASKLAQLNNWANGKLAAKEQS